MKSGSFTRLMFPAITGVLLTGCLLRRPTDSTRHFVLSPISTHEPAPPATERLSVGIGFVRMPSYLLRHSMAVRQGANEIEYIEDALWAERLDHCFQRTLAVNLSSNGIYLTDWGRDQMPARVFINVERFDVDTRGRGTLIAQWRIVAPDKEIPSKSGNAQLARTGVSPRGNPEVIASTLSGLVAEFSRELAQAIRESVKSPP